MCNQAKMGTSGVKLVLGTALCILAFSSEVGGQTAQPKAPAEAQPAPALSTRGWEVSCDSGAAGLSCFARQRIYRDRRRVLTVYVVARAEDPAPKLAIRLPLGTYLPAGALIQFGKGEAKQLLIERCSQRGCYPAEYPLTEADMAAMLKGANLTVSTKDQKQQPVAYVVQGEGFPAAYAKIR